MMKKMKMLTLSRIFGRKMNSCLPSVARSPEYHDSAGLLPYKNTLDCRE